MSIVQGWKGTFFYFFTAQLKKKYFNFTPKHVCFHSLTIKEWRNDVEQGTEEVEEQPKMSLTAAGLEPAIAWSVVRRLIHWATRPIGLEVWTPITTFPDFKVNSKVNTVRYSSVVQKSCCIFLLTPVRKSYMLFTKKGFQLSNGGFGMLFTLFCSRPVTGFKLLLLLTIFDEVAARLEITNTAILLDAVMSLFLQSKNFFSFHFMKAKRWAWSITNKLSNLQ